MFDERRAFALAADKFWVKSPLNVISGLAVTHVVRSKKSTGKEGCLRLDRLAMAPCRCQQSASNARKRVGNGPWVAWQTRGWTAGQMSENLDVG